MAKFCKIDVIVSAALSLLAVQLILGMAGRAAASRGLSQSIGAEIIPLQRPDIFTINLNEVTFGGNGCPQGTVQIIPSPDARTVSVLFDQYAAATGTGDMRDRTSCNMALPVQVPDGISLGIIQVDYRSEFFWAGQLGPVRDTEFEPGFDDDFTVTDTIEGDSIVYSSCGKDVNFRINTSLVARKREADTGGEEVEIIVDTSDIAAREPSVPFFEFLFIERDCIPG